MSDLLGVAGTAVTAYQLALGTVGNNIANVSTEGYSRQEVGLSSAPPRQIGGAYIGTGVVYDRVKRQYDAFADLNLRNSISELSSQEPMVDYTNRVVDLMGSENAGLVSALDEFFSSARGLSTDPASTVLRGEFFRSVEGLNSRFSLISSQLDLVDTESRDALEGSVGTVNTLAQQLAAINVQMAKHGSATKQPAELLDQRDRLLREMSEHVRIRTSFGANGSVNVSLGSAPDKDLIVNGINAVRIGSYTDPQNPDRIGLVLDPYGKQPRSLAGVTSGKLAGIMTFREQVLDSSRGALDTVAGTLMKEVNALHRTGVDAYGQMGGDLFRVEAGSKRVASGMKLAVSDPMRLAAAAQFRVIENANNVGKADATVSFANPVYGPPKALDQVLLNNDNASAAKVFQVSVTTGLASVTQIPAGMKNVSIALSDAQGEQQLQLITRDGRHLLGPPLSADGQASMLGMPGMQPGASYSAAYLGVSGQEAYRDMQVFYGARAEVGRQQAFTGNDEVVSGKALPALLQGDRLRSGVTGIAAGALTLNGQALPALAAANGSLQATEVAAWLNTAGQGLGISATASNEVRSFADQFQLDRALVLNGVSITPSSGGFGTAAGLVEAINAQSAASRVKAELTSGGELVLSNTVGHEGENITIEPLLINGGNALNVTPGTYTGRVSVERALVTGQDTPVELGFGAGGKPTVLADIGFRTSATLKGVVPDDVMVLVSDTQGSNARVSASYQGAAVSVSEDLRAHPMEISFVTPVTAGQLRFRITETGTGTVLAERNLNPDDLFTGITYRGLNISFNSPPVVGDRFVLDGNRDGKGNNDNIRAIAALDRAGIFPGGKTLSGAYIDHTNDMGNVSTQSAIARDALAVVRDQAEENRDKVSGVNLDEEAANLIRFQQAYQASAKVMQVASQLFDAMIALR